MSDYAQSIANHLEKTAVEGDFKRKANEVASFRNSISDKSMEEIREVSQEFEAVFLSQMLKPMFKGLDTEPPFGGGHAEKVFRGMMVDELGKEFAKTGGIGISEIIEKELIQMQAEMHEKSNVLSHGGNEHAREKIQAYEEHNKNTQKSTH